MLVLPLEFILHINVVYVYSHEVTYCSEMKDEKSLWKNGAFRSVYIIDLNLSYRTYTSDNLLEVPL